MSDDCGDGGHSWFGGCAALLLAVIGSAATVITLIKAVIA